MKSSQLNSVIVVWCGWIETAEGRCSRGPETASERFSNLNDHLVVPRVAAGRAGPFWAAANPEYSKSGATLALLPGDSRTIKLQMPRPMCTAAKVQEPDPQLPNSN